MKVPIIAYVTPMLHYDQDTRVSIMQYRNGDTGKVALQIPSEKNMRVYRDAVVNPLAEAQLPLVPGGDEILAKPVAASEPASAAAPTISLRV
jgi:hypothetical protein